MRRQLTRDIPHGYTHKITSKASPAVVYVVPFGAKVAAKGFFGNAAKPAKPAFYYTFKDTAKALAYIRSWLTNADAVQARRDAVKTARKAFTPSLKVGDVLRSSWGYDQTNVEYYEITGMIGKVMVEVREIGQESEATGHDTGQCVPSPGRYIGQPQRKRVLEGNCLDMHNASYGRAYPVECMIIAGAKVYQSTRWSSYA